MASEVKTLATQTGQSTERIGAKVAEIQSTTREVVASLALPVLALIPVMTTMYDRARVRRNRILVSSAALLILGVAGVMLWTARS